ncbi:MAG: DNA replication/repair protein RecF [Candidatus Caenarcaniphilales bacterium]|nr:DNA replication/repair protein RecF [Candidatus Caenarcaniphilales bacterium]
MQSKANELSNILDLWFAKSTDPLIIKQMSMKWSFFLIKDIIEIIQIYMFLKSINLLNYRNYQELFLELNNQKLIILGDNSQGKTNLLEVVQILSLGKSKRASKDAQLVNFDADNAVIHAKVDKGLGEELAIALMIRKSGRRTLKINEVTKKPSDITHKIYTVSFMVDDLHMVAGSPSERRDWLDSILRQLNIQYKDVYAKFEKALSQRNSFIKSLVEQGVYFPNLNDSHREQLSIWNEMFIEAANTVTKYRKALIQELNPVIASHYKNISGKEDALEVSYAGTELQEADLDKRLRVDFIRSYTTLGPHRDDISFVLKSHNAGDFASQGEKRSIVLASKLSEIDLLKAKHNIRPILLLDDVLAELDESRQDHLLDAVDSDTQVIITTTHLGKHLQKWSENAQIINIKSGEIVEKALLGV